MRNKRRRDAMRNAARRNKKREFDKRKFVREIGSFIITAFIVVIAAYSIVQFGVQTLQVVGQSMNPLLENGETVIVNKLVYNFSDPKRYDLIAYKLRDSDDYYEIKRIIGLPGETVRILNGKVYINDKQLTDLPFHEYIMTPGLAADGITLGEDEYFVLGDNCNNSEDSRFANVGNIMSTEILGRIKVSDNKD